MSSGAKTRQAAAAAAQATVQNAKSAADFETANRPPLPCLQALATLAEEPDDKDVIAFYKGLLQESQKSVKDKADQADEAADTAKALSKEKVLPPHRQLRMTKPT